MLTVERYRATDSASDEERQMQRGNRRTVRENGASKPRIASAAAASAAVLALVLTGCVASPNQPIAQDHTAAGPAATEREPAFDSPNLQEAFDRASATQVDTGIVATVMHGKDEWSAAAGGRSADNDEPMSIDDHVRVGDGTIAIVGTIVLQLVHEGALALDDEASDLVDAADESSLEGVTIDDLLSMRSGLADYAMLESFRARLAESPASTHDPVDLADLALTKARTPNAPFGLSATNGLLLAMIAERATDTPLDELVATRVAKPLGLSGTVQPAASDSTLPNPHPEARGEHAVDDPTKLSASAFWGSATLVSTPADLAVLARDLATAPDAEARIENARPVAAGSNTSYGRALASFGPLIGHSGSLPGFSTFFAHDPETDTTVVVAANSGETGRDSAAGAVAESLVAALYDGLVIDAALPRAGTPAAANPDATETVDAREPAADDTATGEEAIPAAPAMPDGAPEPSEAVVSIADVEAERAPILGGANPADDLIFGKHDIAAGTYPRLALDPDDSLLGCSITDPACGDVSLPAWGELSGFPYDDDALDRSAQTQLVDFDGDGWPEIFGVGPSYSEIWSYRPLSSACADDGRECGQFTPFAMHSFFGLFGTSTRVGDTNVTGWLTGRTTDGMGSMRVGDFDGDGRQELAGRSPNFPGTVKLLDWDPVAKAMSIHAVDTAAIHQRGEMYAGDFNGDGRDEYLIVDGETTVHVSWSPALHAVAQNIATPRSSGIHGPFGVSALDGGPDQLVASAYDRLTSYRLDGDSWHVSALNPINSIPANSVPRDAVAGMYTRDLNDDGIDEFIVHLYAGGLGPSAFIVAQLPASSPTGTNRSWTIAVPQALQVDSIRLGDLDGDGVVSLFGALQLKEPTIVSADLDLSTAEIASPRFHQLDTRFSTAAAPLSATWHSPAGADLFALMHETGVRLVAQDGTGEFVAANTGAPAWSADEQIAYEALSLNISQGGTSDLRSRFIDTALHSHDITALGNLRYRDVPAAHSVDEAVFDDVRHSLIAEFNAARTLRDYETLVKNELLTAFASGSSIGGAVIADIENTERASYKTHNDTVDLIDNVITGALVVATLGNGAVVTAIEQATAKGVQRLAATVAGLERSGYLSGASSATGVVSSFMKREVDETSYDAAAVDVANRLADTFVTASTAHDAALAYELQNYSVMMAASHNVTDKYWQMPVGTATEYRTSLQRQADEYAYSVILPKVTVTWSCIVAEWDPRAACTTNTNPHRDAIYWTGNLKVYLAWPAKRALDRIETSWGWGVPRKITDKLFATPAASCTTAWTSTCSFGLDKHDFYLAKAGIDMRCTGLRKKTRLEWHLKDLGPKNCLTTKWWSKS